MIKTIAVITLLLTKIGSYFIISTYWSSLIAVPFIDSPYFTWENRINSMLMLLGELLELSLVLITLFAPYVALRDKAYKLLRIVFLTYLLFYLPFWIADYFGPGQFPNVWVMSFSFFHFPAKIFCAIVFIRARPWQPIEKVNLADYELVKNTSTGHRFIHGLLDTLIMMPVLFQLTQGTLYIGYGAIMQFLSVTLFYGSFFIYYTLAEALFGQTFGKVLTNSVVVGQGATLGFGRIVMRSLFRYIPIDAFTFLAGANWHDKLSSTAVVYINSWEKVFTDADPEEKTMQKPA